ncbi:MAG: hypothetical protein ACJAZ8_001437 [Planctomycetota bacterium]|jgi:hypothetical protein
MIVTLFKRILTIFSSLGLVYLDEADPAYFREREEPSHGI